MTDAPTLTAERLDYFDELVGDWLGNGQRLDIGHQRKLMLALPAFISLARSALNAPGREARPLTARLQEGLNAEILRLALERGETAEDVQRDAIALMRLADQRANGEPGVMSLRQAVEFAADCFHNYVQVHRAKTPPDEKKALVNLSHESAMRSALRLADASTPNRDKLREDVARLIEPDAFVGDITDLAAFEREQALELTDCILAPLPSLPPSVPVGWRLVPVEPTRVMIDKTCRQMRYADISRETDTVEIYAAMLASAPLPPHSPEGV